MRLLGAIGEWTAQEFVVVLTALGALLTGLYGFLRWYAGYRNQTAKQARLLNEHEHLQTDLDGATMEGAIDNQKQLQFGRDTTAAHYLILFRTHNGDGVPKPTTPIKSTALMEAKKASRDVDSILEDWQAEPVDMAFLEFLALAISRVGETVLIDASKLPEGPLRDRYCARHTPYGVVTYVDSVDHHPTFLIALFGSAHSATIGKSRDVLLRVAGRIRLNERTIAEKRARVAAIETQLTKSFEREQSES